MTMSFRFWNDKSYRKSMLTAGRKILRAHESADLPQDISDLKNLFKDLPIDTNKDVAAVTDVDFSHFWREQSWENAVVAAQGADLIVVTLSGSTELPMPVKRWVENWPYRQPSAPGTLVVVFASKGPKCPKQEALTAFFQQIAGQHGLEFICNRPGTPALAGFEAN